jgi:hypothetical protein
MGPMRGMHSGSMDGKAQAHEYTNLEERLGAVSFSPEVVFATMYHSLSIAVQLAEKLPSCRPTSGISLSFDQQLLKLDI